MSAAGPGRERAVTAAYAVGSIAGFVALWHLLAVHVLANPFILPPPGAVLDGLIRITGGYLGSSLLTHLGSSLSVVLMGYAIAVAVGVPLGIAMAWHRPTNTFVGPLLMVLRPIPPPAWIPLAILWFGIGMPGKVFVIAISAFVPCVLNSFLAISEQPRDLIAAARTMGASRRRQLFEVAIPAGLPTILAAMRIALGNAWATVVAAELVVATSGLGFLILAGYRNFESQIMAAGMISIAVIGFAMNLAFLMVERRLTPWSVSDG